MEQVAIYSDKSGAETVQADLRLNSGAHNGLACYLSHGTPVLWSGLEHVQTADSTTVFDVKILQGTSFVNGGYAMFLMAATECSARECRESQIPIGNQIAVTFLNSGAHSKPIQVVPLSIVIESAAGTASKEQLLGQFREFMKSLPIGPLTRLNAQPESSLESAVGEK
jgi:hypothetical protein